MYLEIKKVSNSIGGYNIMSEILREFNKINIEELDRSLPEEYDAELSRLDNGKLYSPLLDNFKDEDKITLQGYKLLTLEQMNTKLTLKERRYYVNYLLKIYQEIESSQRLNFIYDYLQLIGSPNPKNIYEKLEEYQLCKKYPKYFIQNYVKLELPGQEVNFILNATQHAFIDAIMNHHFVRVLKSRQIGISTIQQAILAHNLTFYTGIEQGVISKDQMEASNFQQVTKKMMRNLPSWLFPEFELDNVFTTYTKKTDNYLRTGSVKIDEPNKLFRGRPLTILVIDEQAFIKKLEQALTGILPSVSRAQQNAKRRNIPYYISEISTPNGTFGIGKIFYEHVMESLRGDTIYKLLQLHWSQVPEFQDDPTWYENQKKKYKNNQRLLNQEFELKFLGSQSAIFDDDVIEKLQNYCSFTNIQEAYNFYFKRRNYELDKMEVKKQKLHSDLINNKFTDEQFIDLQDNQLHIFKKPQPGHKYVYGIDVATQTGSDNSVVVIMDYHTREVSAVFLGKLSMKNFTQQIEWIVTNLYTNCKIFPENNGVGKGLQEELEKSKIIYPKLYYTVKYNKDGTKITSKQVGINNNATLRPILMDLVFEFVNDNYDKIYSKLLAMQLIALERDKSGKVIGNKDDIVLQFSFALYQMEYNLFNKRDAFNITYNENDINAIQTIIEEDDYTNETKYDIKETYKQLENHINKLNNNKDNTSTDDELIMIDEDKEDIYNEKIKQNEPLKILEDEPEDLDWISSIVED